MLARNTKQNKKNQTRKKELQNEKMKKRKLKTRALEEKQKNLSRCLFFGGNFFPFFFLLFLLSVNTHTHKCHVRKKVFCRANDFTRRHMYGFF
jgi:hypothetical protein